MPQRLNKGGSLGGLRRTATYGLGPGENLEPGIFSASALTPGFTVPDPGPATITGLSIPVTIAQPTQHVMVFFSCSLESEAVGAGQTVTFELRVDGVVTDTFEESGVLVGSEVLPISYHSLSVALAPGVHTFDVQAGATAAASFAIAANQGRLSVLVLPG